MAHAVLALGHPGDGICVIRIEVVDLPKNGERFIVTLLVKEGGRFHEERRLMSRHDLQVAIQEDDQFVLLSVVMVEVSQPHHMRLVLRLEGREGRFEDALGVADVSLRYGTVDQKIESARK